MKSVVASLGMFAAVANAYSYPRHMHFPRANGTDDSLTTLTVIATQVHTVTSCKPTVTNCPAGDKTALDELPETDKTVVVVTDTVILTETVCPVTEASAIESSVIGKASTEGITGSTITAPIPLSTSYPEPTQGGQLPGGEDDSTVTTITTAYVTDKVVTLTIGTGTDASTVTSTIQTSVQTTITVTCDGGCGSSGNEGYTLPSGDEPTTTVVDLSTEKVTKTIEQADETETRTAGGQLPGGPGGNSNGNGNGNGEGDCPVSTVTVTAPASTVYVTVGGGQTKGPDASETDVPGSSGSEGDDDEEDDDEEDDEDEYCDDDTTTTIEATVTVVPYPVNGTTTGGYAQPTGFSRRLR